MAAVVANHPAVGVAVGGVGAAPVRNVAGQVQTIGDRQVMFIQGIPTNKDEIKRVQEVAGQETQEQKLRNALMILSGWNKNRDAAFISIELDPNQIVPGDTLNISGYQLHLIAFGSGETIDMTKHITIPDNTYVSAQTPVRLFGPEILEWARKEAPEDMTSQLTLQLAREDQPPLVVARGQFPSTRYVSRKPAMAQSMEKSMDNKKDSGFEFGLSIFILFCAIGLLAADIFITPRASTPTPVLTVVREINAQQALLPYSTVLRSSSGQYFTILTHDQIQTWSSHPKQVLDESDYRKFVLNDTTSSSPKFILVSAVTLHDRNVILGFDSTGRFLARRQNGVQDVWSFPGCNPQKPVQTCASLVLDNSGDLVFMDEKRQLITDYYKKTPIYLQ